MNPGDDVDGVRGRALLIAHLHELAVLFLRGDEQFAFRRIVAAGLLDVDVFASL